MRNQLLIFVISLLISVNAISQGTVSKVKIFVPEDKAKLSELIGHLQIDHFMPGEDGSIITELSSEELQQLKSTAYHYEILIPDLVKHLDSVNQIYYKLLKDPAARVALEQPGGVLDAIIPRPAAFEVKTTFGGYYSFAEMEAAMDALVAAYPQIASKTSIGKTHENRDIWLIKISDNVAVDENHEPAVFFMGLQHAREAITGASMIFFMQYLAEFYYKDNRIKDLVDNREIYIIPCFNPDGWEYNRIIQGGNAGGMWRKNRRHNGGTSYGVDLNRNWGVDWANCSSPILGNAGSCGSGTTTSDTYWGPSAFSEPETQAVRQLAKTKKFYTGFDQHAYGPYYSLPFGRKSLHPNDMSVKGAQFFEAIPAIMGKYNGMRAADSYDALGYEVAGGFKDWMLMGELGVGAKDTVWAMTGEGGSASASNSFWPAAQHIVNLSKGMCYQNLQLTYAAGSYVDIQDATDLALSSVTGSFSFRVKRLGIGNDPVTISAIPLENVQSVGAPVTINSMGYYEEQTRSISYSLTSGLTTGQRIKFAWRVETGGYTYYDTIIKILNPIQLFYDNMEGTITNNWTLQTNNNGVKWSYTNSASYAGTKSMTESASGNYTANTQRYATCRSVLNLSDATASYLTFWVKHRAENFRDKLQLQVSINNGSTWTPVNGKTTVKEPGTLDGSTLNGNSSLTGIQDFWIKEVFDLSQFNGNSAIQFRFLFTSGATSSFKFSEDDGFYIDEVKVFKTTSSLVVLPTQIHDFKGKLLTDKTIQLWWEATTDVHHNHFEVERSANGVSFTTIGIRLKGEAHNFNDLQPISGNNFYRIKQVDQNGKIIYSKTINIAIQQKMAVTAYPNPVDNLLHIKLSASSQEGSTLKITDINGRQIFKKRILSAIENEFNINVSRWKPQVYLLNVYDNNGEIIHVQRIVKK